LGLPFFFSGTAVACLALQTTVANQFPIAWWLDPAIQRFVVVARSAGVAVSVSCSACSWDNQAQHYYVDCHRRSPGGSSHRAGLPFWAILPGSSKAPGLAEADDVDIGLW